MKITTKMIRESTNDNKFNSSNVEKVTRWIEDDVVLRTKSNTKKKKEKWEPAIGDVVLVVLYAIRSLEWDVVRLPNMWWKGVECIYDGDFDEYRVKIKVGEDIYLTHKYNLMRP